VPAVVVLAVNAKAVPVPATSTPVKAAATTTRLLLRMMRYLQVDCRSKSNRSWQVHVNADGTQHAYLGA
jgi:hypothetical protein